MKKYIILLSSVLIVSCTSDEKYEDLNRDPNKPTQVSAESLFNASIKSLFDQMESPNINTNVFRLFSQYWTQTTYNDESNYDLNNRRVADNHYSEMYRDVLYDLKDAKSKVNTPNKIAMISVLEVYTWQQLVDTYGNIPYSAALQGSLEPTPEYDDAKTIYEDLIVRINTAINTFSISGDAGFTSSDQIYGGNITQWLKFANSVKFKLAMRIADVPSMTTLSQTNAEEAVIAGIFSSNADNATLAYESNSTNANPVWSDLVESGRNDFVAANTIVNYMNDIKDPRRVSYFDENIKYSLGDILAITNPTPPSTTTTIEFSSTLITTPEIGDRVFRILPPGADGIIPDPIFLGKISSFTTNTISIINITAGNIVGDDLAFSRFLGGTYGAVNNFPAFSHIGTQLKTQTFRGVLLDYAEIEFLLAEATERGYAVGGTAESHYNAGITASMNDWGIATADIATYLAQPSVAYTTATGTWRQKIGFQFWLAMYNRGFEGWSVYRKYDAPIMNIAAVANIPVPKRYTYPLREQTLNLSNYNAAVAAIGGDELDTPIFWDVN
ncbi:SusD/RagB family nutrient-binding outer membrane lipoprotein [Flavobacterium sediminilitoris]|uniref:SusD/RagB family nutrient-binding outer membrane lipoprotein n=1 Tax=Flavobacterium sediminilitoris TaxID=2024526 RepID=A0ABY4HMN8_9FLAO|nr:MULTISPECIES: SusD/RagB family nutrient-binding outer membrane lipoprotein [Flavobacterium]UOX34107.1 SusD/RagB family nutrient-binding outer membrane lipoprotein [Flavobacterium sediminilitoris]